MNFDRTNYLANCSLIQKLFELFYTIDYLHPVLVLFITRYLHL